MFFCLGSCKKKTKKQFFGKSFSQPTAAESQPCCSISACQQLLLSGDECSRVMQPCVSCLQHVKIKSTVSTPQKGHSNSVIFILSPFLPSVNHPLALPVYTHVGKTGVMLRWGRFRMRVSGETSLRGSCSVVKAMKRKPSFSMSHLPSALSALALFVWITLCLYLQPTLRKTSLGDGKDVCVCVCMSWREKVRQAGSRNKLPRWPTFWNPASSWAAQMFLQSLRSWNLRPWNPATTDSGGAGRSNCPSHATHRRRCSPALVAADVWPIPACACFNEKARVPVSIIYDVRSASSLIACEAYSRWGRLLIDCRPLRVCIARLQEATCTQTLYSNDNISLWQFEGLKMDYILSRLQPQQQE